MTDMKIPLSKPYIKKELVLKEIETVLDSKWISGGPAIKRFEDAIKTYNNDPDGHYIAVSNATVGLELALLRANGGKRYKPTDEIIVPSWSWVASGFVVKNVGATPVWCDVNQYGVVDASVVKRLVTPNTKAILIVHQMGIPCDLDAFKEEFSSEWDGKYFYPIPIVEDAACAFGSEYKGRKIGVSDHTVVYSFQARKCLTTGEGGMIRTPDLCAEEWYRSMRVFGTNATPLVRENTNYLLKEQFSRIGSNYKMSDLQCALGLAHLQYFEEEIQMRTRAAINYNGMIYEMEMEGFGVHRAFVRLPIYCTRYNWQNYHVILDDCYNRDGVIDHFRKEGVGCKWDIQAIHLEPAINDTRVVLSNTERFHNHGLWLPFFAEISLEEQEHVIQLLKSALNENEIRI